MGYLREQSALGWGLRLGVGDPLSDTDEGLVRGLSHRGIQLIAIGGTIGVGLFLGSGKAIRDAGPAVILCYAVAGAVVFLMLRALGEMAVSRPIAGAAWAAFVAVGWLRIRGRIAHEARPG